MDWLTPLPQAASKSPAASIDRPRKQLERPTEFVFIAPTSSK